MENRKSGRFVLVRHLSIQHLHFVNRVVNCHGKSYFPMDKNRKMLDLSRMFIEQLIFVTR